MEVSILNIVRILHVTTTGTEYEAYINRTIATYVLHTLSSNLNRSYLTTADHNGTSTASSTLSGFTKTSSTMRRVVEVVRFCSDICLSGKRTNGTLETTAIDTIIDITASHGDISIAKHITSTTTTIDAFVNSNLLSALGYSGIGVRISTDIHEGVTLVACSLASCNIGILTTTKDITDNVSTFGVMRIGAVNCNSCRNILTTCCSDRVTIRIKNLS